MRKSYLCMLVGDGARAPSAAGGLAPPTRSLYERLGGRDAVAAVVHEFMARNLADARIKQRFVAIDAGHMEAMLVEFVTVAAGGPGRYSGRDMPSSHRGMEVVDEEFDAVVENLKSVLERFQLPAPEQGELLGALAPLRSQIVAAAGTLVPLDGSRLAALAHFTHALPPGEAAELLAMAITAGRRGQRTYAARLFCRAELLLGAARLAGYAATFRAADAAALRERDEPSARASQRAVPPA